MKRSLLQKMSTFRILKPLTNTCRAYGQRPGIDALLAAMNRDGEREDYIDEIIRLSEKYKIVTPYTAFLARAPVAARGRG